MTRTILAFAIVKASFVVACSSPEKQPSAEPAQQDTLQKANAEAYACPMCPDQKSDKPAKCGMCGMDMEKKS